MEISFLPWPASHCPPSHSLVHSWVILQVLGRDKWLVFGSGWCLLFPNTNSNCGPGDAGSCLWKAEDLIQGLCGYVPDAVGNSKNGTKWMKALPSQNLFWDRQTNARIR